jgi:iron complex transport system permease protein
MGTIALSAPDAGPAAPSGPFRFGLTILLFAGALAAAIAAGCVVGAADMSWLAAMRGDDIARRILVGIRLPRVLLAALEGATLAVAGVTFQTLLRNPLADPFVLGVSGGAACGASLAIAFGVARRYPGAIALMSFIGACAATAAVFLLARRRDHTDTTRLLLSGLVLNSFFSAIILVALSVSPNSDLTVALRWMMGNISGAAWPDVAMLALFLALGLAALVFIANDLRMFSFGEEDAKGRGVDVERVKLTGFFTASIITGAAVAVSGIIGFIGLLVPHLIRMIWRRDFRFLLPLSAIGGATLLVLGDALSRAAVPPTELPLGALTAFLGVPFFLMLLRRDR